MILPSKYLQEHEAIIGVSATLLDSLNSQRTISDLWDDVKKLDSVGNYERFVLSLDLLFVLGLIDYKNGTLARIPQ